jgi:bifunctional DNA-binding transcriptional regulator/antitoxin component of YhaV-PrlF toxin-antitoxin module
MSGETTKYYKFEKTGSGRITIPISMAKGLNWGHKDEINILIKTINGQLGLFLWKREEEKKK